MGHQLVDQHIGGVGGHALGGVDGGRRLLGSLGFQTRRDGLKLRQRRGEVFDNLAGDDLGEGSVVPVFERLVTQPAEIEIDLVAATSSS